MKMVTTVCDAKDDLKYNIGYSDLQDFGYSSFSMSENVVLFCLAGTAEIELNLQNYELCVDSSFCILGNSLVKLLAVSDDFNCVILKFSERMMLEISVGIEIEIFEKIFRTPYIQLKDENELKLIGSYFDMMMAYEQMPHSACCYEFISGMIRCLMLMLSDLLRNNGEAVCQDSMSFSTADNYFRTFMKILTEHGKLQHDVAFYADKLHITPKYLNEICRKKARVTAKEVITRYVVALIRRELILSDATVQRIAADFNFCDQSSFGKYFKKSTGIAPLTFRRQYFLKHHNNG